MNQESYLKLTMELLDSLEICVKIEFMFKFPEQQITETNLLPIARLKGLS